MIHSITYNWHQTKDSNDAGEDMESAEVGTVHRLTKLKVIEIQEEKDKGYFVIFFKGAHLRVYNMDTVLYKQANK